TIRTARSRTSGQNRLGLVMAPSSQGLEPPGNPGRFTANINDAPAAITYILAFDQTFTRSDALASFGVLAPATRSNSKAVAATQNAMRRPTTVPSLSR